jgi:phage terminase small subunit
MPVLGDQRQELFAQEIAKGKTGEAALVAAGYKPNRSAASRLLTDVNVSARVRELKEAAAEKAVLTQSWVIERLMKNAERSMQREAVLDEDGKPLGEYRYDGNVANRALELLGKELGMFVDRSENVNINHDVSDQPLNDDEWAAEHATSH